MDSMVKTIIAGVACTIIGGFSTSLLSLDGRVIAVETKIENGSKAMTKTLNKIENRLESIERSVGDLKSEAAVRKALQLELKADIDEIQDQNK